MRMWKYLRNEYPLYIFLIPAILFTFFFLYLPMFMNIIAFMDYDITAGWLGLGSKFVGFHWFEQLFKDPYFIKVIWRTFYYSALILIFGVPGPIILALLLNELSSTKFKRFVQSVSYLPHFISWVTIASLIYLFASADASGVFNNIKVFLFGGERIVFMKYPEYFPVFLTLSNIFKTVGWGTILYLAAIVSIDPQLYEAAEMDGANRWHKVWHITLPGILPTIVILQTFRQLLNECFDNDHIKKAEGSRQNEHQKIIQQMQLRNDNIIRHQRAVDKHWKHQKCNYHGASAQRLLRQRITRQPGNDQ